MAIWGLITWWYTEGWRQCIERVEARVESTLDFFSISLLLSTLFAPFRQISAGTVRGSLDVQMRAFFDRIISRLIGGVVRLIMICVGSIVILLNLLFGMVLVAMWALVPVLPIIGLFLSIIGWLPWNK